MINKKGVSIIEILAALVIISSVLLALFSFVSNYIKSSYIKDKEIIAIQVANSMIGYLDAYNFESLHNELNEDAYLIFDEETCSYIYSSEDCKLIFNKEVNNVIYNDDIVDIYIYQYNDYKNSKEEIINSNELNEKFKKYVDNELIYSNDKNKEENVLRITVVINYYDDYEVMVHGYLFR